MNRMSILYRREFRAWLLSPANYVMAAAFLALTGLGFWVLAVTLPGKGVLVSELTFGGMLFWMAIVAMASICSVRLLGEERESGTLELLLTVPVRESEVVAAKFGAGVAWLMLLCLPAVSYPWMLRLAVPGWHAMDLGVWATGVLIVVLVVSLLTATGMLLSQLLRRQLAAAAATFVLGCLVVFRGSLRNWIGEGGANGMGSLVPMGSHIAGFAAGIVDSRPLVFYASGIVLLLFLNVRLLEMARFRRRSGTLNVAVSFVLAGVLAAMVNHLSLRHGVRIDCSTMGGGPLPERTLQILSAVRSPVKITLLASPEERYVPATRDCLERYRQACALIQPQYVNPDTDFSRARELARRFGLNEPGVLVVECGARWRVLPLTDFMAKAGGTPRPGQRGTVFVANLEQGVTAALYALSHDSVPVVYFLTGHHERSIDDFGEHAGYAEIAGEIRDSVAEVRPLVLGASSGVSNDCSVLVVAGPTLKLSTWEVGKVRDYLSRGGRVMFLLDSGVETGLEGVLKEWGVRVGLDHVVDPRGGSLLPFAGARAAEAGEVLVTNYGQHPVTVGLDGLVSVFVSPRLIEPLAAAAPGGNLTDMVDRPRVTLLAMTSPQSWGESDPDQQPPQFNEGYDRQGPVGIAACVEKGMQSAIKMDIKAVRLVVCGDSQFAANGNLAGGNRRLFMNAVDWLMEKEPVAVADGGERGLHDIRLAPRQQWLAFVLTVPALPLSMMLLAGVVALARRDRRAAGAPFGKETRDA